jgi:hypothetical protein
MRPRLGGLKVSDISDIDLSDEFRNGMAFVEAIIGSRYLQMEVALKQIMDDPRSSEWAKMRARCGLAVDE